MFKSTFGQCITRVSPVFKSSFGQCITRVSPVFKSSLGQCITRVSPVFVDNDEISDVVGNAGLHQLRHDIVASVEPLSIGEYQSHLLSVCVWCV